MAKNYILKLEEVEFEALSNYIEGYITEYSTDDLPDLTGSTLEIGGEKFLYAGRSDSYHIFTRDGVMPESEPEEYSTIPFLENEEIPLKLLANKYPTSGAPYTLSVYLYTVEDSPTDSVPKNAAYSNYAHHDLEGIDYLMDDILGLKAEEETPSEDDSGEEQINME